MPNKVLTYTVGSLLALILSTGGVIAAFTDVIPRTGAAILLSALPLAILMIAVGLVNYRLLVPRYFLRQRYITYAGWCILLAMSVPLLGIAMEAAIRHYLALPDRIHNYLSPWILVDSLSTAALLGVIMVGMGVTQVYRRWKREAQLCDVATEKYAGAICAMNSRIHPADILASLDEVKRLASRDAEEANRRLRNLSERLRHDLYDLPKIQLSGEPTDHPSYSRLSEFLSAKRFTLLRDLALKLLIVCISITAIFEAPDQPELTLDGLWAFLGMFIVVSLLTYGNKSISKHFLNKGKLRGYILAGGIFMVVMTVVTIIFEILSYVHTIHNGALQPLYSGLATLSSFCTITLFFGGITALIVLHNWLRTVRRTASLRAETAKAELRFLQSQINPHFLFNVLNNVGILIYEEPQTAAGMLGQLREMFEYQQRITTRERISMGQEVLFIRNYLLLEQSRKSPFEFEIEVDDDCREIEIPTLLLIPLVENASKHSVGNRDISIAIRREGSSVVFSCRNRCGAVLPPKATGGLGISNTRRRLNLLFGDDYSLSISLKKDIYQITLKIPVK